MNNYFEIFWFKIYFYWLVYAIGFLIWYLFFLWLWKQKYSFIYKRQSLKILFEKGLDDLFLAILLWVIIWGRLGHVLIYNFDYYIQNLKEIFFVWNWWMSFIWAIIWVLVGIYYIYKKYKLNLEDILVIIDLMVVIFPFVLIFWRIANFLNQELYGKTIDSLWNIWKFFYNIWLSYTYFKIDDQLRVNTNFLESFLEWFVIFIINLYLFIKFYIKEKLKPGFLTWIFLILYGFFRFLIEFLRQYSENEYIFFLTKTQWIMILFVFVWYFLLKNKK